MKTHRMNPLATCLALAFAAPALADEAIRFDPMVITGSRVEQSTFDLPAAVDVVDSAKIGAAQLGVNASEALASVPGIVVQNRQNYAQDLQISSRGFGARTAFGVRGIRLVADGIPASMPDGQGQAATFNLDRAERIEVMRGPLSSVYGNAAGGVIQLFTPDGKGRPSIEGRFSAGSNDTWKSDLASQGEVGGLAYVVDASRFVSDGYRDHSAVRRDQGLVKLGVSPSPDGRLTFVASSFRQIADDPLGLDWAAYQSRPEGVTPGALSFDTRKRISQQQAGLNYEHRFGEHALQLSTYAGQRSVIQYQSIPVGVQGNPRHSGGVIDFDRSFAGASARWIARSRLAGGRLTTTLGVDYERSLDDRQGYENFIGATLGVKGRLRRDETDRVAASGVYVQGQWQGERWGFSGGLRHSRVGFKVSDHYIVAGNGDDSGEVDYRKTTPTLAATFALTPGVNLYASVARGFETPSLNELFYSGPGASFSFDLKPATSTHLETGIKALLGNNSRLDIALFEVRTRDELVVAASAGGRTSYINAGRTLRRGIEAALDVRWSGGFSGRLAYTGLRAEFDEAYTGNSGVVAAGNRLPGVPSSQLYGELAWKHAVSGFQAAIETLARSRVYVDDTNAARSAPGYAIANLRFALDRDYGALSVGTFLRIDNLFDRQYVGSVIVGDSNGRYYESAPGRNWLAGVTLKHRF
ncbi:TonB-dependent siderophore receptor [Azonexus hydrophilus]|uniref:TonB-dependent siderophore receptor n=1 Tax=Azonexus hydrophilus TaxID=418702 RepID=A0A1R1I5A4_9RHOO|nr:TonB-dependent receptor [Azonexus hydrophilus]OMG53936.1 TonB-dependent siderophore receptor [Azonexus hydrophilus]